VASSNCHQVGALTVWAQNDGLPWRICWVGLLSSACNDSDETHRLSATFQASLEVQILVIASTRLCPLIVGRRRWLEHSNLMALARSGDSLATQNDVSHYPVPHYWVPAGGYFRDRPELRGLVKAVVLNWPPPLPPTITQSMGLQRWLARVW